MTKKTQVKKVVKTIKLNKDDLTVINYLRLDMIKKIEHLKDRAKLCKSYSNNSSTIEASKNDLNNFMHLYNKLYS